MKIKGLPRFQNAALEKVLSKRNLKGEFAIQFVGSISLRRMDSLWYGGDMVEVKYKGYSFHIEAIGDVYADLYTAPDNRQLCYVKDKNNNGNFSSEMLSYFRSDRALTAVLSGESHRYRLDMQHNNWWECFVTDPKGVYHDLMWNLDEDNLFHAIAEVLCGADEVISDMEEVA